MHLLYAEAKPDAPATESEKLFGVLTVATGSLVLLFILGALRSNPGLALVVAMCTAPALLATAGLVIGRHASGKPFTWQSTFAMFAGSLSTMVLAVTAVVVVVSMMIASFFASLGGICTICEPPAKAQALPSGQEVIPRLADASHGRHARK